VPRGYWLEWMPEADALLGTMLDREVAVKFGISNQAVRERRWKLGVLPCGRVVGRIIPGDVSGYSSEAKRIYEAHRRHRKRGLLDTLSWEQWRFACEWFDNKWAYCGQEAFLTEDHLVPLSRGGPRTVLNIISVCWECNYTKRAKQAHIWIYEYFGTENGQQIVDRIVAYLTKAQYRLKEEELKWINSGS